MGTRELEVEFVNDGSVLFAASDRETGESDEGAYPHGIALDKLRYLLVWVNEKD
jgi:hypothetical protein